MREDFEMSTSNKETVDFGPLTQFRDDPNVTDINWNGRQLWIDDITKGRYLSDIILDRRFIEAFSQKVMNIANRSFNGYDQLLEAEVGDIRISIIHETAAHSGRSISIRKSPAIKRLDKETMIKTGYSSEECLDMLQKFVEAKCNIIVCGLPGVGKTELVKWLTTFIAPDQRAITIEDNLELHYPQINPEKDSIELKVSLDEEHGLTYSEAIKASLRQFPTWIILSEVRGRESKNLLESLSTGCSCLTTTHTDDVRKVPDRFKNMVGESYNENEIYENIDVAVLIKKKKENGVIKRYISQIAVFSRTLDGKNVITMVADKTRVITPISSLPQDILSKINKADITYSDADAETEGYEYEEV